MLLTLTACSGLGTGGYSTSYVALGTLSASPAKGRDPLTVDLSWTVDSDRPAGTVFDCRITPGDGSAPISITDCGRSGSKSLVFHHSGADAITVVHPKVEVRAEDPSVPATAGWASSDTAVYVVPSAATDPSTLFFNLTPSAFSGSAPLTVSFDWLAIYLGPSEPAGGLTCLLAYDVTPALGQGWRPCDEPKATSYGMHATTDTSFTYTTPGTYHPYIEAYDPLDSSRFLRGPQLTIVVR